jgi:phage-related protein
MALASRNASVPADGRRSLGNPHRTDLPTKRTARVMLCLYHEHLVALHGFIKNTRATPDEDLALARKRQKELMR